jgi:hypothetical protein
MSHPPHLPSVAPASGHGGEEGPSGSDAIIPALALLFVILTIVGIVSLHSYVATAVGAVVTAAMLCTILLYLVRLTNDDEPPHHG